MVTLDAIDRDVQGDDAELLQDPAEIFEAEKIEQSMEQPEEQLVEQPEKETKEEAEENASDAESFYQQELDELAAEQTEAALAMFELEERLTEAKKRHKAALKALADKTKSGPDYLPLIDQASHDQASHDNQQDTIESHDAIEYQKSEAGNVEEAEEAEEAAEDRGGDTEKPWELITIEEVGIPENICQILREEQDPPIRVLGDLAEFTSDYNLTDLRKIGPSKAKAIEDACDAFWRKRQDAKENEGGST